MQRHDLKMTLFFKYLLYILTLGIWWSVNSLLWISIMKSWVRPLCEVQFLISELKFYSYPSVSFLSDENHAKCWNFIGFSNWDTNYVIKIQNLPVIVGKQLISNICRSTNTNNWGQIFLALILEDPIRWLEDPVEMQEWLWEVLTVRMKSV